MIGRPFGANGTAMARDNAFNDSEANAYSFEFSLPMQALKSFEQFAAVFRIEASSMIIDIISAEAII